MDEDEKKIINTEIKGLFVDLNLWFLSDNIKIDKKRMQRLFNGRIDRIKSKVHGLTKNVNY